MNLSHQHAPDAVSGALQAADVALAASDAAADIEQTVRQMNIITFLSVELS